MTYIKDVATLQYDESLCTGCGMCRTVCPHDVFAMAERKAVVRNRDRCMECGACMMNCPVGALSVEKGVGCAYAVIASRLRGSEEISCDCGCGPSDAAEDINAESCCGGSEGTGVSCC